TEVRLPLNAYIEMDILTYRSGLMINLEHHFSLFIFTDQMFETVRATAQGNKNEFLINCS
ncbi:MAG: hypothetical protein ACNA7F_15330, partial [Roseovarius sp.]